MAKLLWAPTLSLYMLNRHLEPLSRTAISNSHLEQPSRAAISNSHVKQLSRIATATNCGFDYCRCVEAVKNKSICYGKRCLLKGQASLSEAKVPIAVYSLAMRHSSREVRHFSRVAGDGGIPGVRKSGARTDQGIMCITCTGAMESSFFG